MTANKLSTRRGRVHLEPRAAPLAHSSWNLDRWSGRCPEINLDEVKGKFAEFWESLRT